MTPYIFWSIVMSTLAIACSIGSIYITILTHRNNIVFRKAMEITNGLAEQGLVDSNSNRHSLGPNWKAVKEAEKILEDMRQINKSDFCQ